MTNNKLIEKLKEYEEEHSDLDQILIQLQEKHTVDFLQIQRLKKRLNRGGKLFIAIPNFKSFDSKYYGEYWAGYDTPRHLWHFSRESIRLIAKKINYVLFKEKSLHLDSIYVSYLSEKYKRSPFPLLIGIIIGCISILKSLFTKESSSFLFVLKKA